MPRRPAGLVWLRHGGRGLPRRPGRRPGPPRRPQGPRKAPGAAAAHEQCRSFAPCCRTWTWRWPSATLALRHAFDLLPDPRLGRRIFGQIQAEWQPTHDAWMLITGERWHPGPTRRWRAPSRPLPTRSPITCRSIDAAQAHDGWRRLRNGARRARAFTFRSTASPRGCAIPVSQAPLMDRDSIAHD